MTDREFLEAYRSLVREINMIDAQATRCLTDGRPAGIHAQASVRQGGTNHREAAAQQLYEGLSARLDAKRRQLEGMNARFRAIQQAAPDYRISAILTYYYGMGQSDEAIAVLLHYSSRHIHRLRLAYVGRKADTAGKEQAAL